MIELHLMSRLSAPPVVSRPHETAPDREAGFAAVDALVALSILSVTLILSLQAGDVARRSALAAAETRAADAVLRHAVDAAPRKPEARLGRAGGFTWRVEVTAAPSDPMVPALQACTIAAEARALKSGRVYRLNAVDICPLVEAHR